MRLSNSVGIIDSTYRGSIIAVVDNLSAYSYEIKKGDRLFQIVPFCGKGVDNVILGKVDQILLC